MVIALILSILSGNSYAQAPDSNVPATTTARAASPAERKKLPRSAAASASTGVQTNVASSPKPPVRKVSHYGYEVRFASDSGTGIITSTSGSQADVFIRTAGLDLCARAFRLLTQSPAWSDLTKVCVGYHLAQLNSAGNTDLPFNYVEDDVRTIPISLEPGAQIIVTPTVNFVLGISVRKLFVSTAASDTYVLTNIDPFRYGVRLGFEVKVESKGYMTMELANYFKSGLSFNIGYAKTL